MKTLVRTATALWLIGMVTSSAHGVDLHKIVAELQKISLQNNPYTLVLWMPNEYWETALAANPAVSKEATKQFIHAVNDYSIFAIAEGSTGAFGGMTPKSRAAIVAELSLTCSNKEFKPLSEAYFSPDLRNFLLMMKPTMAANVGQFGRGLEFVVFDGETKTGGRLLDPRQKGRFSLQMGKKRYQWRLPLGSLLPPKVDPRTGEEFPGNYNFNPSTGNPLETKGRTTESCGWQE